MEASQTSRNSRKLAPLESSTITFGPLIQQSMLLASGLAAGFVLGWFIRSGKSSGSAKLSTGQVARIAKVGKYVLSHGKIPHTKLALVVRNDLEMTRGKAAAQCGHAAVGTVQNFTGKNKDLLDIWLATGQTKVVLKVDSESGLLRLAKQAEASGIGSFLVRDAGRTEVANGTVTVLAVGPADVKDVDAITGKLKLL